MAVTGALPITVIERNSPVSIPVVTSLTTVRFRAVINFTFIQHMKIHCKTPQLLQTYSSVGTPVSNPLSPVLDPTRSWSSTLFLQVTDLNGWSFARPLCLTPSPHTFQQRNHVWVWRQRNVREPWSCANCTLELWLVSEIVWESLEHVLTWDDAEPEANWWLRLATRSN